MQVDFRLTSDAGLEFGGWTIDDFCIVAFDDVTPPARCGDGNVDPGEQCDDGNAAGGDGCENDCTITPKAPTCGDGKVDPGEVCDDGNGADGDGCESNCTPTPMMMMPDPNPTCPAGDTSCETPDDLNPGLSQDAGGCGCNTTGAASRGGSWSWLLLAGLALAVGLARRRSLVASSARCDRSSSPSC